MKKDSDLSVKEPLVLKEDEYSVFLGLVGRGLWKNNAFISDLIGVDEDTISAWKKRSEVKTLRQQSVSGDLERWKRSSDPEKRLKEQGMEFDPDKVEAKIIVELRNMDDV